MVLQYKGFFQNWCYEEANTVTVAIIGFTPEEKEDIRKRFEKKVEDEELSKEELKMRETDFWYKEVEEIIREDTQCSNLVWKTDSLLPDIQNFLVINLQGDNRQDKDITYIFDRDQCGVYLLNDSGKTVQRF